MATRIYLRSEGSAPVTPSDWEFPNQINPVTLPATLQKNTGSAMTSKTEATGTTSPTFRAMMRFVIGPLKAQTISGTLKGQIRGSESNAGANATPAISVKIIQPGGADRAVLLGANPTPAASDSATAGHEFTTTLTNAKFETAAESASLALTSGDASLGDYLVIEIGFRSATTTSRNITLSYGNDSATDLPEDTSTTAANNPWVEFSGNLDFVQDVTLPTIGSSASLFAPVLAYAVTLATIASTVSIFAPTITPAAADQNVTLPTIASTASVFSPTVALLDFVRTTETTALTRVTTTSSSYVDITGATIAASNFIPGRKYLIKITGRFDFGSISLNAWARVVHGSTEFPGSEQSWQPNATSQRWSFGWYTIWQAVADEDIKLQFKNEDGATTLGAQNIEMISFDMVDIGVEGVDWHFAEIVAASLPTLSNSFQDGASITFTPPIASQDWWIQDYNQLLDPGAATSVGTRVNVSGGTTATDPETLLEGEDSLDSYGLGTDHARVLPASSHTIKTQALRTGASTATWGHSQVLAINLHRFSQRAWQYIAQHDDAVSDTYETVATATLTPSEDQSCFFVGSGIIQRNAAGVSAFAGVLLDGVTELPGNDGNAVHTAWDATDAAPFIQIDRRTTVTAASHTVELKFSMATGAGVGYRNRFMLFLPLKAAAVVADQNVTLPTVASTAAVFAPTLAYAVTLPHQASTVSVFAPTVAYAVTLPTVASTLQVFAPTVSYAVTLPHRASTASVFAPTIAYAVTLPTVASTASVFSPTVAYAVILTHVASTATIFAPTVTPGAVSVTLPTIVSGAQVFSPSTAYAVTLPHQASTISVFSPTIAYAVTLSHQASTVTIFAPTIGYAVSLPHQASTVQIFAPTISAGAVAVTLPTIASTTQIFAPTVSPGPVSVTLPFVSSAATVNAPSVSYAVTLPTIASTAAVFEPSIAYELSLPAIGSTASIFVPSIAYAVSLPTIASTAEVFEPTLIAEQFVVLPAIASTATIFAPIVTIEGGVSLPTIASTAVVFAPTITGDLLVSLPFIDSGSQTFAPSATYVVSLPTVPSQAVLFAPSVAGVSGITLPAVTSSVIIFAPTVSYDQEISLPTIASTTVIFAPSVSPAVAVIIEHPTVVVASAAIDIEIENTNIQVEIEASSLSLSIGDSSLDLEVS